MRAHPAHATTEDLERRASEIRANIDRTLTELEDQLQADRLLNTVSTQLRVSGAALAVAASRTVLKHPKPVAAIGAALVLYSLAKRRRRARPVRFHPRRATVMRGALSVGAFARGVMEAARLVNSLRRGGL